MKIYVASSWRNTRQPDVIQRLYQAGHEPYDFRNPSPGNHGFSWSEIDPGWPNWTRGEFVRALVHPIAERGYAADFAAMQAADACLLLLPCGRSAHLEAGWFAGAGKPVVIALDDRMGAEQTEAELMYKLASHVAPSLDEAVRFLNTLHAFVVQEQSAEMNGV